MKVVGDENEAAEICRNDKDDGQSVNKLFFFG